MNKYLTERYTIRFFAGDIDEIYRIMDMYPDRWDNVGHFMRCAIINYKHKMYDEHKPMKRKVMINENSNAIRRQR